MKKFLKFLSVLLFATLSLAFTACSGDDDPDMPGSTSISKNTQARIKEAFPGLRLDSIHPDEDGVRYPKLTYSKGLLSSYKECNSDGTVDEAISFKFEYTPDTVYIKNPWNGLYKAVIGENGLVSQLICPNGRVNNYDYNADNLLIRYDSRLKGSGQNYYEITWKDGNITSSRDYDLYEGSWYYIETKYSYSSDINKGGILFDGWIGDNGVHMGRNINDAMYYAGLLGRGPKNLPASYDYKDTWLSYSSHKDFTYTFDENGYVLYYLYYENYDGEYTNTFGPYIYTKL